MKKVQLRNFLRGLLVGIALSLPVCLFAQDGGQTIKLNFADIDSIKTCTALVTGSDSKPMEGVAVNFYIKRSLGLLPIATLENTDANGEASAAFPTDIPGDTLGNVTVIARLEDDEEILDSQTIAWGKKIKYIDNVDQRSLWASRSNAPTYLIIASNAIIIGIWGTVGYILFLLFFRVKKSGLKTK